MTAHLTGELRALLTGIAISSASQSALLQITGADATRWLNGMVTNSIQALAPGAGNYNFLLNAQGRIQGDCTVYRIPAGDEPTFVLQTTRDQVVAIQQLLDRFIIMDDVELTPLESFAHTLELVGPGSEAILESQQLPAPPPLHIALVPGSTTLVTTPIPGAVPRVTIASEQPLDSLVAAAQQAGATETSLPLLEALRILEARPRYGVDIRNQENARDLPQETNQAHALHFAKGCYVGQEIVERIRSRGQVHRILTPFRLEGSAPLALPAPLRVDGKAAGELTSVAAAETAEGPALLALGYARREFLERGAALGYEGGTAHLRMAGQVK